MTQQCILKTVIYVNGFFLLNNFQDIIKIVIRGYCLSRVTQWFSPVILVTTDPYRYRISIYFAK